MFFQKLWVGSSGVHPFCALSHFYLQEVVQKSVGGHVLWPPPFYGSNKPVIDRSVIVKCRSVCPDASEDEIHFEKFFRRIVGNVDGNDENFEELAEDFDVGDVRDRSDLPEPMFDHLLKRRNVFVEQDGQVRFLRLNFKKILNN